MRKVNLTGLFFVLAVMVPSGTQAEIVTYAFQGQVTRTVRSLAAFPNVQTGTPITGRFSYITDQAPIILPEIGIAYEQPSFLSIDMTLGASHISSSGSFIATVRRNDLGNALEDYSVVFSDGGVPDERELLGYGPSPAGDRISINGVAAQGAMFLGFDRLGSSISHSEDLPGEILLDSFVFATGHVAGATIYDVGPPLAPQAVPFNVVFSINRVTRIPEPSGALLLVAFVLLCVGKLPLTRFSQR